MKHLYSFVGLDYLCHDSCTYNFRSYVGRSRRRFLHRPLIQDIYITIWLYLPKVQVRTYNSWINSTIGLLQLLRYETMDHKHSLAIHITPIYRLDSARSNIVQLSICKGQWRNSVQSYLCSCRSSITEGQVRQYALSGRESERHIC